MNQTTLPARLARLVALVVAPCGSFLASAHAQTAAAEPVAQIAALNLDRYIVSASRTPQDPGFTPSSVSRISLPDIAAAQIVDLRDALAQEPGVIVSNTGAPGGLTSVLLRGASSHQTLFVVDGVRMNDRSATYSNFLGAGDLVGLDRIEVLRGPQSTLYGSSAMGGVISLNTTQGQGAPGGAVAVTGGSFNTIGGSAVAQGSAQKLSYSFSGGRFETANDLPDNDFERWSYSSRVEVEVAPALLLGATFRGQNSESLQTGSRSFFAPGEVAADNYLTTIFGQVRVGENFTSRLTGALHRRIYDWTDLSGSPWATNSALRNRREILDWQNTWSASPKFELVAGANHERSHYDVDGAISRDDVAAAYVSATANPVDDVTLTAGFRHDDFDSVGGASTWRAGASWRPSSTTKLRATYGTGFSAPGSDDRYGVAAWGQRPNPNLKPEKSRGWDIGVDQTLLEGRATVSATYFQNRFTDLFAWETVDFTTFEGRTVNVARADTEGIELAVSAKLSPLVQTHVSYTYLEAEDTTTGARLIRRPRQSGDVEIRFQPVTAWIVGAGLHISADRTDSPGKIEDYTVARLFASYAVRTNVLLKVRVENALDEKYDDVFGYAALPRGVFGSVEWRF